MIQKGNYHIGKKYRLSYCTTVEFGNELNDVLREWVKEKKCTDLPYLYFPSILDFN